MLTDPIAITIFGTAVGAWIVFHTIPRYVRYRKRKAEAVRKCTDERAEKEAAGRQEDERKTRLRERDGQVDPILRKILLAKIDLKRLLAEIDEFDIKPEKITQLQNWRFRHQDVMDFCVYKEIAEHLPKPNESEPFLSKDEIDQLLDEHCDAETCLEYADEKLGIQRGFEYWDGVNCGGVNHERGNGRYEEVNTRFERILRKLP